MNGVDETKCISGKFKMVWEMKVNGTHVEALVAVPSGKQEADNVFQTYFRLKKEHLLLLTIRPTYTFRLSLRGAKLERLNTTPPASTIPMQLSFSDGVCIQWNRPGDELNYLNTWNGEFYYTITRVFLISVRSMWQT